MVSKAALTRARVHRRACAAPVCVAIWVLSFTRFGRNTTRLVDLHVTHVLLTTTLACREGAMRMRIRMSGMRM